MYIVHVCTHNVCMNACLYIHECVYVYYASMFIYMCACIMATGVDLSTILVGQTKILGRKQKLVKSDKCMGNFSIIGGTCMPGLPPKSTRMIMALKLTKRISSMSQSCCVCVYPRFKDTIYMYMRQDAL